MVKFKLLGFDYYTLITSHCGSRERRSSFIKDVAKIFGLVWFVYLVY